MTFSLVVQKTAEPNLINPQEKDVGRLVVFCERCAQRKLTPRTGMLVGFKGQWAWVEFEPNKPAMATAFKDLTWEHPVKPPRVYLQTPHPQPSSSRTRARAH